MLLGSIPLVIIALFLPSEPIQWSVRFIAALIYTIVFGTTIARLLWLYILNKLPAGVASMGTLATPVIGVVAAWIQLGEIPDYSEAMGMLLIGTALSLEAIYRRRRISLIEGQE